MSPSREGKSPVRTVRVLIVEDAMDHALLLKTFLRSGGHYEVTHAQDGDRAIALIDEQPFDIVITDLNLPGTDGFDVMRHVRDAEMGIPVLAVTGYTEPQYAEAAFRAGAGDVLPKPLMKDELLAKVRDLLRPELFSTGRAGVLAVGARPGDVEVGCGGALARHAEAGQDVVIIIMESRMDRAGVDGAAAAGRSAEHLGARLLLADASLGPLSGPSELQLFVARTAKELGPRVAYVPAPDDQDPDRAMAARLALAALADVPLVLGYPTVSSREDFSPDRFTDVGEQMAHKAESLAHYQTLGARRRDLTADWIQSQAFRRGDEAGVPEAEGFVVLRDASREAK